MGLGSKNRFWAILVKIKCQASHMSRTNLKYTIWWAQHVEIKEKKNIETCKVKPANFQKSWLNISFYCFELLIIFTRIKWQ